MEVVLAARAMILHTCSLLGCLDLPCIEFRVTQKKFDVVLICFYGLQDVFEGSRIGVLLMKSASWIQLPKTPTMGSFHAYMLPAGMLRLAMY
jgi:hypothetical protein